MVKMNKEVFVKELEKINIILTEKQLEQLEYYCNFLLEKNKETNLTAIKEKDAVYLKHFYDSITILNIIDLNQSNTLLDIGTGAGFPGMVLKILFPKLKVTLLDSNNKKISFLKELAKNLELDDIEFIHDRSEDFYLKTHNQYDVVVARAVSNLRILSELCIPFVNLGKYFISMKAQAEDEIKEAEVTIELMGANIEIIKEFELPYEGGTRTLIKIKKIKETPKEYPRRYDKILKYPLKKKTK